VSSITSVVQGKEAAMDSKRIITFLVGAAVGIGVGWTVDRVAASPAPAATSQAVGTGASGPRSIAVVIPGDKDYVKSSMVTVAGMAYGRPHGPRVDAVRVELLVGGRLIDSTDLAVHGARFAGTLQVPASIGRVDAELRVSDPNRPRSSAVIRRMTIDPPTSAF
jgi:hypothetical protein